MKSMIIQLVCWLIVSCCLGHSIFRCIKYPDARRLKIVDGKIYHPTYGVYPETVEFHQGMDLMPGQKAVLRVKIEADKK